ncbi:class I SAM-dependent methyltransferase [bacterium]|nr:class I SAM-dependent methyltransferase [bacterium]
MNDAKHEGETAAPGKWAKLRRDPIGTLARAARKMIIDRVRYGRGADYDAARYWGDRLARHGVRLTGVGDEGLSEADNARMYEAAARVLQGEIAHAAPPANPRVLEIGCGNGFFTALLAALDPREQVAVDITDALFERLAARHPNVRFLRADVTADTIDGAFDIVLFLDVIEHIVDDERFAHAMQTAANAVAPGGVLFVSPVDDASRRPLFYVRHRVLSEIAAHLPGFETTRAVPFRYSRLLVARRKENA